MNKYLTVKKYIDEMDYLGLLASHAPDDEFDEESTEISERLDDSQSVTEIAQIIAEVFNRWFNAENDPKIFTDCARKIYDDMRN